MRIRNHPAAGLQQGVADHHPVVLPRGFVPEGRPHEQFAGGKGGQIIRVHRIRPCRRSLSEERPVRAVMVQHHLAPVQQQDPAVSLRAHDEVLRPGVFARSPTPAAHHPDRAAFVVIFRYIRQTHVPAIAQDIDPLPGHDDLLRDRHGRVVRLPVQQELLHGREARQPRLGHRRLLQLRHADHRRIRRRAAAGDQGSRHQHPGKNKACPFCFHKHVT